MKQLSRGFQSHGKCDYRKTTQMKNELLFSSELKKVKHYKYVITKIDSAYKKTHPVVAMSRSIYSLLKIPGRHLLKRKAIPYSGANTTSQHHQMSRKDKEKGGFAGYFLFHYYSESFCFDLLSSSALFFHLISFTRPKHHCHCRAARNSILYALPSSHSI